MSLPGDASFLSASWVLSAPAFSGALLRLALVPVAPASPSPLVPPVRPDPCGLHLQTPRVGFSLCTHIALWGIPEDISPRPALGAVNGGSPTPCSSAVSQVPSCCLWKSRPLLSTPAGSPLRSGERPVPNHGPQPLAGVSTSRPCPCFSLCDLGQTPCRCPLTPFPGCLPTLF